MYGGGIRRGPDAALTAPWDLKKLFTIADDATRDAWRIECERVGPILHRMNIKVKKSLAGVTGASSSMTTSSAWRMHLNSIKYHSNNIERAQKKKKKPGRKKQRQRKRGITCYFFCTRNDAMGKRSGNTQKRPAAVKKFIWSNGN